MHPVVTEPIILGVQRDGDWQIAQYVQQTGHFPGAAPQSNGTEFVLMFVLLFLICLRPSRKAAK